MYVKISKEEIVNDTNKLNDIQSIFYCLMIHPRDFERMFRQIMNHDDAISSRDQKEGFDKMLYYWRKEYGEQLLDNVGKGASFVKKPRTGSSSGGCGSGCGGGCA